MDSWVDERIEVATAIETGLWIHSISTLINNWTAREFRHVTFGTNRKRPKAHHTILAAAASQSASPGDLFCCYVTWLGANQGDLDQAAVWCHQRHR